MLVYFNNFFETITNSPAKRNKFILITLIIGLIINISIWIYLYLGVRQIIADNPLVTTIPLHYNVFLGIDLLGPVYTVYMMPLISSVIMLVNGILAFSLYSRKTMASYFLTFSALLAQIILLASTIFIVLLNT